MQGRTPSAEYMTLLGIDPTLKNFEIHLLDNKIAEASQLLEKNKNNEALLDGFFNSIEYQYNQNKDILNQILSHIHNVSLKLSIENEILLRSSLSAEGRELYRYRKLTIQELLANLAATIRTLDKNSNLYKAAFNVYFVASRSSLQSSEETIIWRQGVILSINALQNKPDAAALLQHFAKNQVEVQPKRWKLFFDALLVLAGITLALVSLLGVIPSTGISFAGVAAGTLAAGIGFGLLFYHGRSENISTTALKLSEECIDENEKNQLRWPKGTDAPTRCHFNRFCGATPKIA